MNAKQQEMIEYATQDIIAFLMEDKGWTMNEAMDYFYSSRTFEKLEDIETGLYLEGSAYIYEYLKRDGEF